MPKSWTWIAPYTFAILAVLLTGPLLSSLALVQPLSVPYLQLSGSQAIRLAAQLFALTILWFLAFAAYQHIPDNGRGSTFLRNLILPFTTLIIILFANKSFKTVGLSLIEQMGPSRFASSYAVGLVGSGLWLTAAWILNQGSLRAALAPPQPGTTAHVSATLRTQDCRV
jgi:hypothetical protein